MKVLKSRLKSKLRGQAGETIAETLIALLISALALTMLAGAISAAVNIITKSETVMTGYYQGINNLGNPATAGLELTFTDGKLVGTGETIDADYALNESFANKAVIAYKKH